MTFSEEKTGEFGAILFMGSAIGIPYYLIVSRFFVGDYIPLMALYLLMLLGFSAWTLYGVDGE